MPSCYAIGASTGRRNTTALEALRTHSPDGRGVKEFVAVLKLNREHPAEQVQQAVHAALELGAASLG
jgi:hypothetical protein